MHGGGILGPERVLWYRDASPQSFYPLAGKMVPWFSCLAAALGLAGVYVAYFVAPGDPQQGDLYRIAFMHVPAGLMSIFIFLMMAFWSAMGLIRNGRIAGMMATALAPTGAMFTFLALWTGALWAKPTLGTWWMWDARLASKLLLLFLYIAFMALQAAIEDARRADRAGAMVVLAGVMNVPIIYFSVQWWNTLHEDALDNLGGPAAMPEPVLWGLVLIVLAFWMYSLAVSLSRVRCVILERERHAEWVAREIRRQG